MPRLSFVLFVALAAMQLTGCVSSVKSAGPTCCPEFQADQGAALQSAPNSTPSPVPSSPGYDDYDDRLLNKSNQTETLPAPIERTGFFPKLKAKSVSVVQSTEDRVRNMFD